MHARTHTHSFEIYQNEFSWPIIFSEIPREGWFGLMEGGGRGYLLRFCDLFHICLLVTRVSRVYFHRLSEMRQPV